ncbi:hypothetical protein BT93_J1252 [Corymbia citriodora subsp. variegata]|nr:hypothetical protein BT93_J1252 [Corymbia citriodora subsp. variegata]
MRMRVHCCRACQKKAKKILEKADGVQAICIDIGEGSLTITGDVEPFILIEMVEKEVRKKVELRSFQRYPAHGSAEEWGGSGGCGGRRHEEIKVADLLRARDRKKAAHGGADRERVGHAHPAPVGPHWPGPGGCHHPMAGPCQHQGDPERPPYHPMAGPCQHQGDPERPPFWCPHGPPPPVCFGGPPQIPPPYHYYQPMPPPTMQPPPPCPHHHEAQRRKR